MYVKLFSPPLTNLISECAQYAAIQGVFEVEVFLLTCDSMRCSKEF
jgi:hypothetical protein